MTDARKAALSVLVVDDSRVVIKRMQEDRHHESRQRRKLFRRGRKDGWHARYDVLFLDWFMVRKSGVALMEQCREDRAFDSVAFVIVSGEAGATSYIVKPFTLETLQEHLGKVVTWLEQRGRFKPSSEVARPVTA